MNGEDAIRSEDAWTELLAHRLHRGKDVSTGIGDDAAVVSGDGEDLVLTSDAVIESIHFVPGTDPRRVGHKMVGRLLSDIAAMGGLPRHILINLVVDPRLSAEFLGQIYEGAESLARSFGADIVGGDTVRGDRLALHGFATGRVPRGAAVLRSGAAEGDRIYVTGTLGGSLGGKHLDFTPRVAEGVWLREGGWAAAMMDISDGLARDLPRLCRASGVGAEVLADAVPLADEVKGLPLSEGVARALGDGEDYELLFAVRDEKATELEEAWQAALETPLTCIGTMTGKADSIALVHADGTRKPLESGGYDHLGG